ncbi:MAG: BatA domain-containing protein, partial [Verrucomicrobiota bacterium]
MTFLTPLFLLGTLAVAGPILFHLVRQATRDRVPFSSLEFLRAAPPRLDRRSRVEHWLLLLLRCAAIVLLGLGFARPFLKGVTDALPGTVEARRVVVLLDTSASLQRPGVWDRALERVRHHLRNQAGIQDLALVTFDRTSRVVLPFTDWRNAPPDTRTVLVEQRLVGLSPGWGD